MTWETPDGPRVVAGSEACLLKHAIAAMVDTFDLDTQAGCDPAEYGITLFDELSWEDRLSVLDQVGRALFLQQPAPQPSAVLDAAVAALFNQIMHEIEFEIETSRGAEAQQRRFWRSLVARAFCDAFHESADSSDQADDAAHPFEQQLVTAPPPGKLPPNWCRDSTSGMEGTLDELAFDFNGLPDDEDQGPDDLSCDGLLDLDEQDDDEEELDEELILERLAEEVEEDAEGSDEQWISIYDAPPLPDCRDLEVWYDVVDALTDRILPDRDFDLADRFLDAPPTLAEELRATLGIANDYFVTPPPGTRDPPARLAARLRQLAK